MTGKETYWESSVWASPAGEGGDQLVGPCRSYQLTEAIHTYRVGVPCFIRRKQGLNIVPGKL